jgi:thermostable 8-oxoguanine DNA glycosylase
VNGFPWKSRLDDLSAEQFTQQSINEIVLWKADRYVELDDITLQGLNELKSLTRGQHRRAEIVLEILLLTHGVDLPVASTILRFRNPRTFQIIDRHAYRAVYGTKYSLYTTTPLNRKIAIYFNYLDELVSLCESRGLDFETVDRLLYIFDKEKNGAL